MQIVSAQVPERLWCGSALQCSLSSTSLDISAGFPHGLGIVAPYTNHEIETQRYCTRLVREGLKLLFCKNLIADLTHDKAPEKSNHRRPA